MKQYMECVKNLVNAITASDGEYKEDDLDNVRMFCASFARYVDKVYKHVVYEPIYRASYDGSRYRYEAGKLDSDRRSAHEAAISSCQALNKLCLLYGTEPFCEDKYNDRYAVADFVGQFVFSVYLTGINAKVSTMDDVVEIMERRGIETVSKDAGREAF